MGQFGRQCGGPAPIGGQLTLGKGPDVQGEVGISDTVDEVVTSAAVASASVGSAVGGIEFELELVGHGSAVVVVDKT